MWRPHFRLWQPFAGGPVFVFMQSFGWLLYGVSLMLAIVYLSNSPEDMPGLGASILAPLSFVAQMVVLSSVTKFDPGSTPADTSKPSGDSHWDAEALVSLFLSVVATALYFIIDTTSLPVSAKKGFCVIAAAGWALSAFVTHAVAGPKRHKGWRLWMPLVGGVRFVTLQATGWTLACTGLCLQLLIIANPEWTMGLSFLGIWCLVGQWLLLQSLGVFESPVLQPHERLRLSASISGYETAQVNLKELKIDAECLCRLAGECDRPVVRSLLLEMAGTIQREAALRSSQKRSLSSTLVGSGRMLFGVQVDVVVCLALCIGSLFLFLVAELTQFDIVAQVLVVVGAGTTALSAIITHVICGPRLHPGYKLFGPFQGGFLFMLLQGLGWTLMGFYLLFCLTVLWVGIDVTRQIVGALTLMSLFGLTSSIVLLNSLRVYEDTPSYKIQSKKDKEKRPVSTWSRVVDFVTPRREAIASSLVSVAAFSLFVVTDVSLHRFSANFPVQPVVAFATTGLVITAPLTFWSSSTSCFNTSSNILIRIMGLALWSFTVLLGALASFKSDLLHIEWVLSGVGLLGVVAQVLLVVSLDSKKHTPCPDSATVAETPPRRLAPFRPVPIDLSKPIPKPTLASLGQDSLTQVLVWTTPEVVCNGLACASREFHFMILADDFWRGYFTLRWGSKLDVTYATQLSTRLPLAIARPTWFVLSSIEGALSVPNEALEEHSTQELGERSPGRRRRHSSVTSKTRGGWRLATMIQEAKRGEVQLRRCHPPRVVMHRTTTPCIL